MQNDIHILSTRPLPQSTLIKAFENGITIDVVSFIKTEAVTDMPTVIREAAINFFGETSIKKTARNAVNLAEKIVAGNIEEEIIFFCSDHRLDKLPTILKTNKVHFKELIVYKTIETPVLIEKHYEGILFFSPSAVHSFFSQNTIATDTILFSIGKTTAGTIATYASNEVVASEWPGQEQLISQVISYYNEIKHE
jgi:uroporphyrinogen-III synthase